MQSCAECGHLNGEDANFCDQCGNRLLPEPAPPVTIDRRATEPEPSLVSRWWVWLLGAVLLLVAIGAGAALVLTGDAEPEPAEPVATPEPVTTPDPAEVQAATGVSRVRLAVINCTDCTFTAVLAGEAEPQVATVADGAVEFALPTASTLGLGFTVQHPDGYGLPNADNAVVLSPVEVEAGASVAVSEVIAAERVAVCWGGTLATERNINVIVERYADGTSPGGLRAWASPAEPGSGTPIKPTADGAISAGALNSCRATVE